MEATPESDRRSRSTQQLPSYLTSWILGWKLKFIHYQDGFIVIKILCMMAERAAVRAVPHRISTITTLNGHP